MSLEMAHKVILPPKKNYIPQFLKQRDINSYKPCYLKSHIFTPHYFLSGHMTVFVTLFQSQRVMKKRNNK
jgi:hypothetical protein